ncbi:MAG TPA: metallophosphoesterase [Polyangiaceae bacterium]
MMWRAVLALCMLCGCGDDTVVAPSIDASVDDGGRVCVGSAVTKGPWVLGVDDSHATIRWETCRGGTSGEVNVAVEGNPSAGWVAHAVESETDLTETHVAALNPQATPDWAGAWFMHEAKLVGIAPNTCYAYSLAGDPSRTGRFCTARPSGAPLRIFAVGDTNVGLGPTMSNILSYILPMKPELTLHVGDLEYYDSGFDTWQLWADVMRPLLAQGGFFAAIGNHESETPDEYADYTERFFHGSGFAGTDEFYEIETAGIHFFILDTQDPDDEDSAQAVWFAQQIVLAEREPGYRFSIVFFHKPFVTCGDTGDDPVARAYFEPLFIAHKVPLVLQGHMHGYERFDFGNITYVTTGGGGGALGDVNANTSRDYCDKRVASGRFFNGTILDIGPMLKGTVIDDHGTTQDNFELTLP